jgi:hypothetical protein
MRRRRSRRSWRGVGRRRKRTGSGRRLRLPGRDRLRNRRLGRSSRNSRRLSQGISSEKMMSLSNAKDLLLPEMRKKTMMITFNNR